MCGASVCDTLIRSESTAARSRTVSKHGTRISADRVSAYSALLVELFLLVASRAWGVAQRSEVKCVLYYYTLRPPAVLLLGFSYLSSKVHRISAAFTTNNVRILANWKVRVRLFISLKMAGRADGRWTRAYSNFVYLLLCIILLASRSRSSK